MKRPQQGNQPISGRASVSRRGRRAIRGPRSRRGAIALVTVYLLSLVMFFIVVGNAGVSYYQTRERNRYVLYKDEFASSEMALNEAYGHVQFLLRQNIPNLPSEILNTPAPNVPGYEVTSFDVTPVFSGYESVTSGQWKGLTLNRLKYRFSLSARDTHRGQHIDHPGVGLAQNFEITYIPLFNFAIFYDLDVEIGPGADMNVIGKVHCNNDAWIETSARLNFYDTVSIVKKLYHGNDPDNGEADGAGDVYFHNGTGLVNMKRSSGDDNTQYGSNGWLDARDSDWATESVARWNGNVRDQSHNVQSLNLPIPTGIDPHVIIERALPSNNPNYIQSVESEKFENKAGVKIYKEGNAIKAVNSSGTTLQLQYHMVSGNSVAGPHPSNPSLTKSVVSEKSFYDAREGKHVKTIDVNMGNVAEYKQIIPANGILYVSNENQGSNPGVVRLVNGAKLPTPTIAKGFTVATDDPIYVQGNYNTTNPTLAMVAGDAMYALSNAWSDSNSASASSPFSSRNASDTTMNVVILNGILPSGGGQYSGGVENYFRFLENWTDKWFNYKGSIIQLWKCKKALGVWGQANVYSPPKRNFSWDTALGGIDGPPGAPRVVEIVRTEWEMNE